MLHPNGASRKVCPVFLHGSLHIVTTFYTGCHGAWFVHCTAQCDHVADHPHLCKRQVLYLITQVIEKPIDVWRSIWIDYQFSP